MCERLCEQAWQWSGLVGLWVLFGRDEPCANTDGRQAASRLLYSPVQGMLGDAPECVCVCETIHGSDKPSHYGINEAADTWPSTLCCSCLTPLTVLPLPPPRLMLSH